ncbi:YbjN domain-containing protein [Devosia sp. ZB163]|uniref:YbjN domain-containing protein n=1 Tax=Devosia sp. ZB163 TaxID=3025938 RepID=UPI00235EA984|nr:YbjN domain-containing protein [Devosia sp. ZB163]MDC9824765.1 YbjN domain-containing protein [Devosia sp. ZB163]
MKLAAAVLAAALLASPALSQEIVDGSKVDEVVAIAKGYGTATLESQPDGAPRIAGSIGDMTYYVFFMNCAADKACEDLNFYAAFADIKPTLDALNAWNRDKRFGNAYLDSDLDAAIEYDVNLEHGVTRDNLDAAFSLWSVLLQQYADYVGFTPAR